MENVGSQTHPLRDFDTAQVEARRITVDATRIALETFPLAVPLAEAERNCARHLARTWTERERAAFALPPSRLALDPADVLSLRHDGRDLAVRVTSVADAQDRRIEAVRQDSGPFDGATAGSRSVPPSTPAVHGTPIVALMDLPQLSEDMPAHRPLIAAFARPWPGDLAVLRSPAEDGFTALYATPSR